MIIWRGWGILAFFAIGLCVGLTGIFSTLSGATMATLTWQAIPAFFIGGVAIFFLGRYVNVVRPTRIFAQNRALSQGYVEPSLDGSYAPLPLSQQPPLNAAEVQLLKRYRNRHSLFWIPMQWWGIAYPLFALGITVANTR
ncbi:MAG: hypothetical protein U0P48_08980 [Ancrocorticia sp.]